MLTFAETIMPNEIMTLSLVDGQMTASIAFFFGNEHGTDMNLFPDIGLYFNKICNFANRIANLKRWNSKISSESD